MPITPKIIEQIYKRKFDISWGNEPKSVIVMIRLAVDPTSLSSNFFEKDFLALSNFIFPGI